MSDGFDIRETFNMIVENLTRYVTDFVPRALTGIVILLVGWLVAKLIQRLLQGILGKIKFDEFLERLGITAMLTRAALRDHPSRFVPRIIYYVIVILFVRMAAIAVGLNEIADAINAMLAYVPSVFAAIIILLFGNVIAQFAGNAVAQSADNSGIEYSKALGRLVSAVIVFLVMVFALAQLKIDMSIVNSVVLIVFAGFALAFAMAFGLGTRGIMRNIVAGFYARKLFKTGDEVEVAGVHGKVTSINAVTTLLERKGTQVAIPNQVFVDSVRA
jgi:small-conductance mechanosensitive channel